MKKTIRSISPRSEAGSSRLAVGLVSVAAGLGLLLTPLGASGQVVANDLSDSITITQTPSGVTGECVPASLAIVNGTVTNYVNSDASAFTLTIHSSAPLCEALTAKAVVWAMPGNGVAWPQTLKQVKSFSILEAGDTVVSFSKLCDPAQFDVLAGDSATPDVIAPDGAHHGPLLFPFDDSTAFQHVGNANCVESSTTVATTTSTSVVPTSAPVVQGTSTIAAPTTIKAVVRSDTTVPLESGNSLAATGSTTGPFALMGGGLVFIGLAAMLASRRRTAA